MIPRLKRQTKKRHSVVWPERTPRIRFRHNMTEVVFFEAESTFVLHPAWKVVTGEMVRGQLTPLTPDV